MKITKELTIELISFAKRIKFSANYWDPSASSAFEFCRNMSSPKLKKKNPNFECELAYHEGKQAPFLIAEFSDGSEWKTNTNTMTAAQLRQAFWERAVMSEEIAEQANIALEEVETVKKGAPAKGGKK